MSSPIKPEDIKIYSKEESLWLEIKEQAQKELEKIEEVYFKTKTFNEKILLLAIDELTALANEDGRKEDTGKKV